MTGTFGPYHLLEELGSGGAGRVLRAEGPDGEIVAVKTVQAPDRAAAASIRREIVALARIQHPGVVRIRDHGVHEGQPWYAMDLVEGPTLREWAASQPIPLVLRAVAQLVAALEVVHSLGIVHRDVTPSNVLMAESRPVLMDFGLATPVAVPLDERSGSRGSVDYRAPEQIRGQPVDARADLYAIGVILYEMVAGEHPMAQAGMEMSRAHLHHHPIRLSRLEPVTPAAFEDLTMRLLAKRREQRPAYASDVIEVLDAVLGVPTPRRPVPNYLYPASFVGRTHELEVLGAGLDRVAEGGTGVWMVGGVSGSGKSRLASEVARDASRRGWSVIACECRSNGGPLHGWRPVLTAVADFAREGGPEREVELLTDRGPVLAPYSGAIASLPGVLAQPEAPSLRTDLARVRLMDALIGTLGALARGSTGLLVVIDDAQWADEVTLDLVRTLAEDSDVRERVAILGLYRTEEARAVTEALEEASPVTWLSLSRLQDAEVGQMIAEMLGTPVGREPLVERIESRCDGNPFYVAELLRAAVERGVLFRRYGSWRLDDSELERLPASPWEAVDERIGRCGPEALRVLQAAAVLGKESDGDLLSEVSGLEGVPWYTALEALRVRHLVSDDGHRFRFFHDIPREVAYASIPSAHRTLLHQRAVTALEALGPRSVTEHADIARHLLAAGRTNQARERFELASRLAERQYAGVAAVELAMEAFRLEREPDEGSIELRYTIAGPLVRQAHFDRARALTDEAWDIAVQIGADAWLAPLQARIALMAYRVGDLEEVDRAWDGAMAELEHSDGWGRVEVYRQLGSLARERGKADVARDLFESALKEPALQPGERTTILGNLALAEQALGDAERSEELHLQVLELSEQAADLSLMGAACGALAVLAHRRGELDRARELYQQAIRHHRRSFQGMLLHAWINNLAELDRQQGRFEEARTGLLQTVGWHGSANHGAGHAIALANLAAVELELGDLEAAVRAADRSVERAVEAGSDLVLAQVHAARAKVASLLGDPERARIESDRAMATMERVQHAELAPLIRCARAHVLLYLGEPHQAMVDAIRTGLADLTLQPDGELDRARLAMERALDAHRVGDPMVGGYALPDVPGPLRPLEEE